MLGNSKASANYTHTYIQETKEKLQAFLQFPFLSNLSCYFTAMAVYSSRIAAAQLVNLRNEVVFPAKKLFQFRVSNVRNLRMGIRGLRIRGLADNSEGGFESSGVVNKVIEESESFNENNGVRILDESDNKLDVDNGSGGDDGGKGKVLGGSGGGDGFDPEDEEFGPLLQFAEVMREIEARGAKLPSDMLEAAKSVGIRKVLLERYLDLQVCGFAFLEMWLYICFA